MIVQQDFLAFPAPAKLNLFLHIVGQRTDGYHLLQTVFQLIDYQDVVYLKPRTDGVIGRAILANVSGLRTVPEAQDLCLRAAKLLQTHTGCRLGVDIAIEKRVPMGGGLGGGSSDAATVLLALNQLWGLHLSRAQLQSLGLQLGADVPFFIFGQNAWAEGIGEVFQALDLAPKHYVVLTPDVHVSTREVFASKALTKNTLSTTMLDFSRATKNGCFSSAVYKNDLQAVVCQQYPQVAQCVDWLNQFSIAHMTGSGASVFAAFDDVASAQAVLAQCPKEYKSVCVSSMQQHPLLTYAS